jgi:hypothetical protein
LLEEDLLEPYNDFLLGLDEFLVVDFDEPLDELLDVAFDVDLDVPFVVDLDVPFVVDLDVPFVVDLDVPFVVDLDVPLDELLDVGFVDFDVLDDPTFLSFVPCNVVFLPVDLERTSSLGLPALSSDFSIA